MVIVSVLPAYLPAAPLKVELDRSTGEYTLTNLSTGWKLKGSIGTAPQNVRENDGRDANGRYHETSFGWSSGSRVRASIRVYGDKATARFSLRYLDGDSGHGITFPAFDSIPQGLKAMSCDDDVFSHYHVGLTQTSTPWLFFDDAKHAFLISPADSFMNAKMSGDGIHTINAGFDEKVKGLPKGTEQASLVVFADGIGKTWNQWGEALRNLHHRAIPASDGEPMLKYFGYWTDNGADYYYNYDLSKGYAETILALGKYYKEQGIPLGYLQLDSWWYRKTTTDPDGRPGGATKNPKLPYGMWNRYGGTYEYRADPALFPNGLAAFQKQLGLPLAVHSRWIDRKSSYAGRYNQSGVAMIDPRWWKETTEYLKRSGVICYEQDWLNYIFNCSPELSAKIGPAVAFSDGMANACKEQGMTMQYCMGLPRNWMQGVNYSNLTTIRTCGDRFEPGKYSWFLYGNQFAYQVGAYPWCDVYMSGETDNMILAVLSAGPVGTGDRIGKENKANILKACLPDGALVKPDVPIVPVDQTYLDEVNGSHAPCVAATYTEHHDLRTSYVFAYPRRKGGRTFELRPKDLGQTKRAYVLEFGATVGRFVSSDESVSFPIGKSGFVYAIVAPETKTGIVLLGDLGKFATMGKKRVTDVKDTESGLDVQVSFAEQEASTVLSGVSPVKPTIRSRRGSAGLTSYDPTTGRFEVRVSPSRGRAELTIRGK